MSICICKNGRRSKRCEAHMGFVAKVPYKGPQTGGGPYRPKKGLSQ